MNISIMSTTLIAQNGSASREKYQLENFCTICCLRPLFIFRYIFYYQKTGQIYEKSIVKKRKNSVKKIPSCIFSCLNIFQTAIVNVNGYRLWLYHLKNNTINPFTYHWEWGNSLFIKFDINT